MQRKWLVAATAVAVAVMAVLAGAAGVSRASSSPSFTIIPLLQPNGGSETAISINSSGFQAMTALSWNSPFGTHMWTGAFGTTPVFQGDFDLNIAPGILGGGDADVDLGSTGTLHATSLIFINHGNQLGVSALACPNADTSNKFANCKLQVIDTTTADRQWITSDGPHVWIAYHDSANASLVHVQRSDDDGLTFHRVGDPIVGQGATTGNSTFNNENGPIVADPTSHVLYDVFAAGVAGLQKGTTANFNHVYVARSFDGGVTWSASLVYTAPVNVAQNNVFPSLAVDPANSKVYATWSDLHHVFVATSTDHGASWSAAQNVAAAPVTTAVMPWVSALNGTVDVVYYGTQSTSNDDPSAVWNVYLAQSANAGGSFAQTQVSPHPNHVGVVCLEGISCAPGTRNLLDLFEVALNPQNGKTSIVYTDDTLTKDPSGAPLPQAVLAQQN
ncbi:MAG TPA: sialidase family protein [Streptosporangiaceae bacterium]